MTVRTRLLGTMALMAALLLVPAIYAAARLREVRDIARELRARHAAALLAMGRLHVGLAQADRFQRSYVATREPELRDSMWQALALAREQLAPLAESGYGDVARHAATRLDALEAGARATEALVESGRVEEATAELERLRPVVRSAQEVPDLIARAIDEHSEADVRRAERIGAAATRTALVAACVFLALAGVLGLWTTGALTAPLRRLRGAMAAVASGRFVAPPGLPYGRRDEIGDVARSFRSMTQQLAELDRLKAEFVGVASHELRAPLSVISGYASLLEEGLAGPLTERQREAVAVIQEQVGAVARLVDQLLDLSRIEAGGLRIEPEEVELDALLAPVARSFAPLAARKGIEFRVQVEPSAPARLWVDAECVRNEVLGNLLSNALKFTPAGGRVELRAAGSGGSLLLSVADTGVGIPEEELPHIFDKYYQVGAEARAGGAGLGLPIARQVVEAHGGAIAAESRVGVGTTFRIRLPVRPPAGGPAPSAGAPPSAAGRAPGAVPAAAASSPSS